MESSGTERHDTSKNDGIAVIIFSPVNLGMGAARAGRGYFTHAHYELHSKLA